MSFVIEDTWLPATLTVPPMTDEQFGAFCADHPDLFFEMTADGELIVMRPNYTLTGIRNGELGRQLTNWARTDARGICSDASTGFVLPNGARRSPDADWISKARIHQLAPEQMDRFWHLCPEFVIELRSQTDRLPVLRAKMREWLANGAELAWLIDPERRAVEVYRPHGEPETVVNAETVAGEGPVAGFNLDLIPVWDPLGR